MLLIDCGNSALKARLLHGAKVEDRVFPLIDGLGNSGFEAYLRDIPVSDICLSSVARAGLHDGLIELLQRIRPVAKFTELKTLPILGELKNGYRDHRQLGVDRWLTIVAAADMQAGDVVIVDAGTAIKLELLSARSGYLGGAILPGFNTSMERFRGLFAGLDLASAEVRRNRFPGTSTAECIRLNPFPVREAEVNRLIREAMNLLEQPVTLLLTGQDAARVAGGVDLEHSIVPDLVFRGMLKQLVLTGTGLCDN